MKTSIHFNNAQFNFVTGFVMSYSWHLLFITLFLLTGEVCWADSITNLTEAKVARIVDAIKRIENSTKYPYGIKSINTYGNETYARKICRNTVINTHGRWLKAGAKGDFLDYLADRYCPPSGHDSDPKGNYNWKKNIHKLVDNH